MGLWMYNTRQLSQVLTHAFKGRIFVYMQSQGPITFRYARLLYCNQLVSDHTSSELHSTNSPAGLSTLLLSHGCLILVAIYATIRPVRWAKGSADIDAGS